MTPRPKPEERLCEDPVAQGETITNVMDGLKQLEDKFEEGMRGMRHCN